MADINLGRIGFVPKGAHNPASSYAILDTVVYAKNGYCCIKPVPVNSGILPTNTEYFVLLVEKGEQGIPGPGGTGPKGDTFTYDDLTTEQLGEITAGIEGFTTHINPFETKVGVISLFGVDYDLYRSIAEIANIPTTLNAEATYTLAEIPLGFNLYLKTDSLVVAQEAGSATTDFFNDSYKISRLFVDSDLSTKVTIKCIQAVTTTVKATIQVEYIKDFGDVLELNVTVPAGIDPANVNLTFPKLKYNKKNAATLLVEDNKSCWNAMFSACNKRWVDNERLSFFIAGDSRRFSFHKYFIYIKDEVTYTKSAGQYPSKFMEYTDGAGVKHRYAFTLDSWWNDLGTRDAEDVGWAYTGTTAKEVRFMQDFGMSLAYHDLQSIMDNNFSAYEDMTQEEFNIAVERDRAQYFALIDRSPKIISSGANRAIYLRAIDCPQIVQLIHGINPGAFYHPFSASATLDIKDFVIKCESLGYGDAATLTAFKNLLIADSIAEEASRIYRLLALDSLYVEDGFLTFFNEVEALFGVSGDDSLWMPSIDEFYEYWFMRTYARAYKTIDGQNIKFKIHAPCNANFWFKSISCLLSGITDLTGISVTSSDNCPGTSFGINDNQLLVNLDFNTDLLSKVEKYLAIFEAAPAAEYAYDDALYFIQQLKVGVKESYEARLNAFVSAPTLTAVLINAGAATTSSNYITVALSIVGSAAQMMLSEDVNFAGASWVPFAASTPFTLSPGFTEKTIYVQLRNAFGDSSVLSDSISLIDTPLVLSAAVINSGASVTNTDTVSLAFTYAGAPTQMMLSESPDFTGASWVPFSATPSFVLSAGYAVKTIYAKLQNATVVSGVVSDSIEYAFVEAVALASIVINAGAENTSNNVVSVALSYTGSPTQYRISESATFVGASWITLSGATVSFAMSAALGVKTIYAQIQNTGGVSAVRNDTITLTAGAVKAVVSLNTTNTWGIVYDIVNGGTICRVSAITDSTEASKRLKSTSGVLLDWYQDRNSALYFQANAETITTDAYLTDEPVSLSGDTGIYPDLYLSKTWFPNGGQGGPRKGRLVFTLPVGSYKFKLLMSTVEGYAITAQTLPYCFYRIDVGGTVGTPVQVGATGFTGVGNREFNAEIDIVVPSAANGNVVLYVYNDYTSDLGYRPGINLIEISKTA